MRVLLIGGSGNISAECASQLRSARHEVWVVTRGQKPVPAGCHELRAERHDMAQLRSASDACSPEVVINFLGYELADVQMDFEIFQHRIQHYIFISSATVYLKPPPCLPITEDAPLGNPWWEYARKKQACEEWLLAKWKEANFPVTIVRPSHTYSKIWIPNAIASSSYNFAARMEQGKPVYVLDDGEGRWTLTASSDFAVALAGLIGNVAAAGEAFHITSDEVLSWNQIYAEIAAALGVETPVIERIPTEFICQVAPQFVGGLKGDKAHAGVFDNRKIKEYVPGFVCRKNFRTGIRESVDWLRAHPEDRRIDPKLDAVIDNVINAWAAQ